MKIDDIKLWLANIELNTTLMRKVIERALRDEKMSEIDASSLDWHLERIDRTTKHIKELAEQ